jgi:hypothetical protein
MKSAICSGSKKSMEILFNVQPTLSSKKNCPRFIRTFVERLLNYGQTFANVIPSVISANRRIYWYCLKAELYQGATESTKFD